MPLALLKYYQSHLIYTDRQTYTEKNYLHKIKVLLATSYRDSWFKELK